MKPIETPDGQFVDGTRRVPGTPVPAWWLNQQQAEPLNVIKAAGLEPDKDDDTQLLKAINKLAEAASQVSSIEALRQYTGSGYVNVNGYYDNTPGQGGGIFVADEVNKSQSDNGGTWIVASNGTRWRRVYSGALSLRDFGYDPGRDNALAALNHADTAALGAHIDCLGLTIDVGKEYPQGNQYANGKFIINGETVDVQYQPPRNGIGRFVAGSGALENIQSSEWTGNDVTAIGKKAMQRMERCVSGIAIGSRAQGMSTKSRDNIAIGADALINVQAESEWYSQSVYKGTRNVAVGGNALRGVVGGYGNVGIGRNAGQGLGDGYGNVVIGNSAGGGVTPVGLSGDIEHFYRSNMSNSVAIGTGVLSTYQGKTATAVGGYAANNLKTTVKGTFLGYEAGKKLDENLAPNGGDVLWSGTQGATYTQSGTVLKIAAANLQGATEGCVVGIRLLDGAAKTLEQDVVPVTVESVAGGVITTTSSVSLTASGGAEIKYVYSATSSTNANTEITAIGYQALANAITANRTVAVGANSLSGGTGHDKTIAIGDAALGIHNHVATIAIGYWTRPDADTEGCVFIGDTAGARYQDGRFVDSKLTNAIAIGRHSRVAGDNEAQIGGAGVTVYASSQINVRSDLRDKADIEPLTLGSDFICRLNPISGVYDKRDKYVDEMFTDLPEPERAKKLREWWANPVKDGRHKESKRHFWFGAQDLAELEQEFGKLPMLEHQNTNGSDTYSVAYAEFVPVLVKALQETIARVDELERKLEDLK